MLLLVTHFNKLLIYSFVKLWRYSNTLTSTSICSVYSENGLIKVTHPSKQQCKVDETLSINKTTWIL